MGKANGGKGGKGSSSQPQHGGNWPSTTGNRSGGSRGNANSGSKSSGSSKGK